MAAAPIPALIDSTDSMYQWILANVAQINPLRKFGGIIDARDWPPKSIILNVPYLAILSDLPTKSPHQSFYAPLVSETVEWRWVIQGDNIPQNAQAANRGDKYRQNVQIMQELLSAHNPGYAPKSQWTVASGLDNEPVYSSVAYNPPEFFWWSLPAFSRKIDRQSGMIYNAARVEISNFAPISSNLG
jgi:hypothetical protein